MQKTRVLIIDDSAIVRRILTEALSTEPDIEVVGTASDPIIAKDKIASMHPDVLTLDVEMPRMDGISFLRQLMAVAPMPVVVVSSMTQNRCAAALDALEAGAVEVLGKPSGPYSVGELRFLLAQKIRSAAKARLQSRSATAGPFTRIASSRILPAPGGRTAPVIAIGASTGGTDAILRVLERLPGACPPIVVVQHIPANFSTAFAHRLDRMCPMQVKEAADGDLVLPGHVLIAPGDVHMLVRTSARGLCVQVKAGPRVCYQRPSVDVLFHSVADLFGKRSIGVLLTGMGNDGAAGLLKMRRAGARTLAQDEHSCVVYGMPKEAYRSGAVEKLLPLERIPEALIAIWSGTLAPRVLTGPAINSPGLLP